MLFEKTTGQTVYYKMVTNVLIISENCAVIFLPNRIFVETSLTCLPLNVLCSLDNQSKVAIWWHVVMMAVLSLKIKHWLNPRILRSFKKYTPVLIKFKLKLAMINYIIGSQFEFSNKTASNQKSVYF